MRYHFPRSTTDHVTLASDHASSNRLAGPRRVGGSPHRTEGDAPHVPTLAPAPAPAPVGGQQATAELEALATAVRARRPGTYERFGKPMLDRVVAAVLLVLVSPVLVVVALLVRGSVGRPILYGQRRAGLGGTAFTMWKFRTMRTDRRLRFDRRHQRGITRGENRRADDRRVTHKTIADPRHTPVGRVLRKLSLDELPQLINVLRGDMSLVGPRPELYDLAERFAPWQTPRHMVRPGITGLWQTTERGQGKLLHECVELDLRYIAELSASTDLGILLRTPLALLRNRGVV